MSDVEDIMDKFDKIDRRGIPAELVLQALEEIMSTLREMDYRMRNIERSLEERNRPPIRVHPNEKVSGVVYTNEQVDDIHLTKLRELMERTTQPMIIHPHNS